MKRNICAYSCSPDNGSSGGSDASYGETYCEAVSTVELQSTKLEGD